MCPHTYTHTHSENPCRLWEGPLCGGALIGGVVLWRQLLAGIGEKMLCVLAKILFLVCVLGNCWGMSGSSGLSIKKKKY